MISAESKDRFSEIVQEIYNFTDYYSRLIKLPEEGKGLSLNCKNNGIIYMPDLTEVNKPSAALRFLKLSIKMNKKLQPWNEIKLKISLKKLSLKFDKLFHFKDNKPIINPMIEFSKSNVYQ